MSADNALHQKRTTENNEKKKGFKKAKFAWQIKGQNPDRSRFTDEAQFSGHAPPDDEHEPEDVDIESSVCDDIIQTNVDTSEVVETMVDINVPTSEENISATEIDFMKEDDIVESTSEDISAVHVDIDRDAIYPPEVNQPSNPTSPRMLQQIMNSINCNEDYIRARRRHMEMGHAIVDNLVNKILENMGLSPDIRSNLESPSNIASQFLEMRGINIAIENRGLRRQVRQILDRASETESDADNDGHGVFPCNTNAEESERKPVILPPNMSQNETPNIVPKTSDTESVISDSDESTTDSSGIVSDSDLPEEKYVNSESQSNDNHVEEEVNTNCMFDLAVSTAIQTQGLFKS